MDHSLFSVCDVGVIRLRTSYALSRHHAPARPGHPV